MKDQYGRQINYMRVSVTDRCNLRCIYCMPEGGSRPGVPPGYPHIRTRSTRIVRAAAAAGITRIKLTGGEPLVRKNLAGLAAAVKALPGIRGSDRHDKRRPLKRAAPGPCGGRACSAVNISLDTLDPAMYASDGKEGLRWQSAAGGPGGSRSPARV